MFIRTETTPNPSTLKFIPGIQVMSNGTAAYSRNSDLTTSPLAQQLFTSEHIVGIFLGSDFITITKSDNSDWDLVKTEAITIIMDHHIAGGEIYIDNKKQNTPTENQNQNSNTDSEIIEQIKELIEERVRPAVAMDGGDIIFDHFKDGIVYVHLHGSCSGCPSSSITLKNGIENMLKYYIPEIISVEAL